MVKLRTWGYFADSAGKSMLRNSWMTLASIGTVAVSLLVLGVFLLVAVNVNTIAAQVESQVELTAYLHELSVNERQALEAKIKELPGVTGITFVSKDQAWERLLEWYGNDRAFLAGWEEENPLRESLEIRTDSSHRVTEVANALNGLSGVDEVLYGREIVDKLLSITRMIRLVGIVLMGGLALAAMFIIANTIRITVFARRREIGIMRFVGATDWFIRWPFVMEGLALGVVGALVSASILAWGYYLVVRSLVRVMPFWPLVSPWPLLQHLALLLLALGAVIGIGGSTVSLRRYLDV